MTDAEMVKIRARDRLEVAKAWNVVRKSLSVEMTDKVAITTACGDGWVTATGESKVSTYRTSRRRRWDR